MEDRLQRIEDKIGRIEEWIEEEQGIIDTMAAILIKTATTGDPSPLEAIEAIQEKARCITQEPLDIRGEPPTITQLLKMLSDPEVRRGLYLALQLLKRLGSCSKTG